MLSITSICQSVSRFGEWNSDAEQVGGIRGIKEWCSCGRVTNWLLRQRDGGVHVMVQSETGVCVCDG